MTGKAAPKYRDLPKDQPLTAAMLAAHVAGEATYAATLDWDGQARVGVIDIDTGGVAAVQATLARLAEAGLCGFGIAVATPAGHAGGHIWVCYQEWCDASAIRAQLAVLAPAEAEIWPSNQSIRLPFGVHRLAGTRGQLLTQAGQCFDLDDLEQCAAAWLVVQQLEGNRPPPALPVVAISSPPIVPVPHQQPTGRLDARSTIQQFNTANPLADLLRHYGCREQRDGWSCACGVAHTHPTTLIISRLGRLFSFSPRCHWRTEKGLDAFGLFCLVEHAGNTVAALKALTPPRRHPAGTPHAADAQRKREAMLRHVAAVRASVEARASQDEHLSMRAQIVLQLLLNVASTRDWCRPGIAALARMAAGLREQGRPYSERTIQLALAELEQTGYLRSTGQGGRPHDTAIRRFQLQGADDASGACVPGADTADEPECADGMAMITACVPAPDYLLVPDDSLAAAYTLPDERLSRACESPVEDSTGAICSDLGMLDCTHDPDEHEILIADDLLTLDCTHDPDEHESLTTDPDEHEILIADDLLTLDYTHDPDEHESLIACETPENPRACEPGAPEASVAQAGRRSPAPEPDEPAPLYGPDGAIAYPDGAAWLPTLAAQAWWEALPKRIPAPVPEVVLDLEPPPATGPILPPAAPLKRPDRLAGYRDQVAMMDTAQLAGEQRKHQRTIQKYPGAHWIADIRSRLRVVAEELHCRAKPAPRAATPSNLRATQRVAEQLLLFDGALLAPLASSAGMLGVAQARAVPTASPFHRARSDMRSGVVY